MDTKIVLMMAALAVGCGGSEFSAAEREGSAGAGMGGSAAGMAGSGGMGGSSSAGTAGAYAGPPEVTCEGGSLYARGLTGPLSLVTLGITVESREPPAMLASSEVRLNFEEIDGGEWDTIAGDETVIAIFSWRNSRILVPSDVLMAGVHWRPEGATAMPLRCDVAIGGAEAATWTP